MNDKLTPKQERFIQNIVSGMTQKEEDKKTLIKCLKIYMGDYSMLQQYACSILLKMILKEQYKEVMNQVKEELGFKINDRNNSKVIAWKKKIKNRGKCEICDSTTNLVAHHIIPWEYSIKGRTDVSNGQCLCNKCHKMIHNDEKWIDYKRGCLNE